MRQVVTIGSVPNPITAGREVHAPGEYYEVLRETGRQAWTFLLMESGRCGVDMGGAERLGERGHFYAIEPGAPHHYGTEAVTGKGHAGWTYCWAHVFPRPMWEPWLHWPRLAAGLRGIAIPETALPGHLDQFRRVVAALEGRGHQYLELAMAQFEVLLIMSDAHNPQAVPRESHTGATVAPAFEWIKANIHKPIPINELAHICGMSRSTFCRAFRAATGYSARDYIERRRIMLACQHLQLTHDSVTAIAERVGFRDIFYFSLRFKKRMGISPLAFRKANAPDQLATPRPRKRTVHTAR